MLLLGTSYLPRKQFLPLSYFSLLSSPLLSSPLLSSPLLSYAIKHLLASANNNNNTN